MGRPLAALSAAILVTAAIASAGDPPPSPAPDAAFLLDLPVVEAASLHVQTLEEAPANVTVITEQEIHRFGYRTLAEALSGVRGLYVTDDRSYHYVGVRGLSLPGDYNTRFLVMLNGHCLTENIYSSNNYFGQDFGLDMDLVKRIEIIRGPSSALYGSNGMFATVNVITKSPVEQPRANASAETDSFGERKALFGTSLDLGHGANLLVSGSTFNNSGQSFYFPELDTPQNNNGRTHGVDGERGYHAFANLVWRNWSLTGLLSSREKNFPTPSFGTIFGDRGNKILDRRDFLEAAWSKDVRTSGKLRWRTYYDQSDYRARYDMPPLDDIRDNRDQSSGDWVGTQLTYRFDLPRRFGSLTLGSEVNADIQALQRNYDVQPAPMKWLDLNDPDFRLALFLQHEWQFRPGWTVDLGLRFDESQNHGHFLSPRIALVYRHSSRTTYKLIGGVAFRDPSVYEQFYDDRGISQAPNPLLRPEQIHNVEVCFERKLGRRLNAVATAYYYRLRDLIEAVPLANGLVQYQNVSRYNATGAEFEMNGNPWKDLQASASIAVEDMNKQSTGERPPNSPVAVGKARLAVPFDRGRFSIAGSFQFLSPRATFASAEVASAYLADLTLTTSRLHPSFDVQFGVRNLFDRRAWDPASPDQGLDRLARDGRSAFIKLVWHTRQ